MKALSHKQICSKGGINAAKKLGKEGLSARGKKAVAARILKYNQKSKSNEEKTN